MEGNVSEDTNVTKIETEANNSATDTQNKVSAPNNHIGEQKFKKEIVFQSPDEEATYYKLKYEKYKLKYNYYSEMHQTLRKDYSQLLLKHEKTLDELNVERLMRKKYEEELTEINNKFKELKKELEREKVLMRPNSDTNFNFNFNFNNSSSGSNEESPNPRLIHSIVGINHPTMLNLGNQNGEDEKRLNVGKTNSGRNIPSSKDFQEKHHGITPLEMRKKSDIFQTSSVLKEKAMVEISQKFDTDKIKRSMIIDFLEYEKDGNLRCRNKIMTREEKLNRFEKTLKIWVDSSDNLKKSIDNLIISLNTFASGKLNDIEIFDDCPDVISLIYCLQGILNDMTAQFKIFSVAVENSFMNPLKEVMNIKYNELRDNKALLNKQYEDFLANATKILNTKKSLLKETVKDNYFTLYKTYEFSRYDYINKINASLLFMKVDLPEKMSLLIYAFICLFKQGFDMLGRVEFNVSANLEKIAVKYKEKEKILEEIIENKKSLKNQLETANSNIDDKEGFIHIKCKDSGYFKKRYCKILNGSLVYYKIKKGSFETVDFNKQVVISNLLFTNVKKNEKDYEYPFCFEVVSAANKKAFLLQAFTEREANEWFFAIRNAISNCISGYNNDSSSKEGAQQNSPRHLAVDAKFNKPVSNEKQLLEKIISHSKCMDCGADKPVWYSLNWFCLICIECSGIHRSLGVQITKIRGLMLDNIDMDTIELIQSIDQEKINKIIEHNVKSYEKPNPSTPLNEKELYITNKYKFKKYFKNPFAHFPIPAKVHEFIFDFIDNDDIVNIFNYVKLNVCDINKLYEINSNNMAFVHFACQKGKLNSFKMLIYLGCDYQIQDGKNLKPIDYATMANKPQIVDFILRRMEEANR